MGLRKSMKFKGFVFDNCYIKLCRIDGSKKSISFVMAVYKDEKTANENENDYLFITKNYFFKPDFESNENIWRQAYKTLKQQEEFQDAEDV